MGRAPSEQSHDTESSNATEQAPLLHAKAPEQPSTRKRTIALFALLLIVVAGAITLTYLQKDKNTATSTQPGANNQSTATERKDTIHFQLGSKIMAYSVTDKKQEILTTTLPQGANVLDIYQDASTWRTYYQTSQGDKIFYWLLEKDGQPKEVVSTAFSMGGTANAQQRVLAYTVPFSYEEDASEEERTTRSYVVSESGKQEILRSDPLSEETVVKDQAEKSPSVVVSGVSADGSKVLFTKLRCFYCDGGATPTGWEMTLADKSVKKVYESSKNGGLMYAPDGKSILATETDDSALGSPIPPADQKVIKFAQAGSTGEVILDVASDKWTNISFSHDATLVSGAFASDGEGNYFIEHEGVYRVTAPNQAGLQKLNVTGLPNGFTVSVKSAKIGECYGVILGDNSQVNGNTTQIGVVCVDAGDTATYTKLDETTQTIPSEAYENINVVY